jgi:mannose-6-phosphate isomerase-like protein (cupin superfamily)
MTPSAPTLNPLRSFRPTKTAHPEPAEPPTPSQGTVIPFPSTPAAPNDLPTTNSAYDPIGKPEPILRSDRREIGLLVAAENLSLTYASQAAGERVAGQHIHHQHTDAFYVLEGELTFQIGAKRETVTIGAGGFVAAPPGVAHSFRTAGGHPARWLTIHARDGGLPADHAIVSRPSPEPQHSF